ncbi:MAG: methylenetetrahydrofolate--tRNA-(uracil(54)-C(5))-methyltransferase (FADH(2)-oxidizing) TrmFO [Clostridia bacterium]|nr:methylenetetrahydrofolate--tRNA-(uracil(54)-C(5))-methyltransferase (FADH(2)-oxidizing) TrmFO [Clostridia bacterium]
MEKKVNVIGAGLAGTECAYILSKYGIKVKLYEMKPNKRSPAHVSDKFGELVCSNSLKSELLTNACGLLKEEMRRLGSLFVEAAYSSKVPAGNALAVDREKFAEYITNKIKSEPNIEIVYEEVEDVNNLEGMTVIATGPLTSDSLSKSIAKLVGDEGLYFYDAAAPIITKESIDMTKAYRKDRYGEVGVGDYLNLAMSKEEYDVFYNALINAESANRHEFDTLENIEHFEGCMPVESLARRGEQTLVFGPLKPVGLYREDGTKPYAVLQLRAEDEEETMFNLVGFQTSLKFSEQKRVFSLIPGLENMEFLRYGVMHRNTYINGPKTLNKDFRMRHNKNIYFAGQISGVEGYVESAASGLMVAYNIIESFKSDKDELGLFDEVTILGALSKYVSTENKDYAPMNANFGIVPPLENKIKDKKERYTIYASRSLEKIEEFVNEHIR